MVMKNCMLAIFETILFSIQLRQSTYLSCLGKFKGVLGIKLILPCILLRKNSKLRGQKLYFASGGESVAKR